MPIVPRPQLGRHLTAFTITGQAVAADGTLSDSGSVISLWGNRRGNSLSGEVERSEINHASSTRRNEVVISDGQSMTVDIFLLNNGTEPNALDALWAGFDYFKVSWTAGTGASQRVYTGYFVRGNRSINWEGRGESIGNMEFGPADVGQAQVAVS